MVKPLRETSYFRAGFMGLPFCIVMGFIRREPIFLLGGGFFAALLFSSLYENWKAKKAQRMKASKGEGVGDSDRHTD